MGARRGESGRQRRATHRTSHCRSSCRCGTFRLLGGRSPFGRTGWGRLEEGGWGPVRGRARWRARARARASVVDRARFKRRTKGSRGVHGQLWAPRRRCDGAWASSGEVGGREGGRGAGSGCTQGERAGRKRANRRAGRTPLPPRGRLKRADRPSTPDPADGGQAASSAPPCCHRARRHARPRTTRRGPRRGDGGAACLRAQPAISIVRPRGSPLSREPATVRPSSPTSAENPAWKGAAASSVARENRKDAR